MTSYMHNGKYLQTHWETPDNGDKVLYGRSLGGDGKHVELARAKDYASALYKAQAYLREHHPDRYI